MTALDYATLRNGKAQPRLHGNGFIQLDLPDGTRLNIWHPNLVEYGQVVRTPIHDHRFSFHSEVILGSQDHQEYAMMEGESHYLLTLQRLSGTEDTKLLPYLGPTVDFRPLQRLTIPRGSSYDFEFGLFHETAPVEFTATVMTKTYDEPLWTVRVGCPVDMQPDNEFDREDVSKELLWSYIKRVCVEVREDRPNDQ